MTLRDSIPCELLHKMYVDEGKSYQTIAKELGCGTSSIHRRRMECKIPDRKGKSVAQIKQMAPIEKESLHRMYVEEKKSEKEIGRITGYDHRTIRKHLLSHGIELRARHSLSDKIPRPILYRMYVTDKRSAVSIADEFGCSPGMIGKLLKKHGIKTRIKSLHERLTKSALIEMYSEKKMEAGEIAKVMGCDRGVVHDHLRKHNIQLHEDHSKERGEYRKWCLEEGKNRRAEMIELLGGRCAVCRRDKVAMHIHHMYYMPNDAVYENYSKNQMEYYVKLYPLVKKEQKRFLLLCGTCHWVIGSVSRYPSEKAQRLLELVREMDSMRAEHPTRHDDLITNADMQNAEKRPIS